MRARLRCLIAVSIATLAVAVGPPRVAAQPADFALQHGDVVVTLGDSNTAPGGYQQVLERFSTIRYPSRSIRYVNAGLGGDTATGGLARLQRDVFDRGATVLIVTYGINDICWGFCDDAAHRQAYRDAITSIVSQCVARGIRVWVTTYPFTGGDLPSLHALTTDGMNIATGLGQGAVDVYTAMRALNTQNVPQCLTDAEQCPEAFRQACRASCNSWAPKDGIHLGEKGHRAWAYALVKAFGAPATVSTATVDAPSRAVSALNGATITNVAWNATARRLTFTRLDAGQPFTLGSNTETYLNNLEVPFHTLAGYMLRVTNLPAGTYQISVGGQLLGTATNAQLGAASGVNLSALAPVAWAWGGPWMFQNSVLGGFVAARSMTNWLLMSATPGSAAASFLAGADALAAIVEGWAAAPTANAVVVEPAP